MSDQRKPIVPERLRRIDGTFAFIPHRFLRDGFFSSLTGPELHLYLLLVLVADRDGVSFYSHQRLCSELSVTPDCYLAARAGLLRKDLIAASGNHVQVLSLPRAPVNAPTPVLDRAQQVSACRAVLATLASAQRK
jgi:hypothetical protein